MKFLFIKPGIKKKGFTLIETLVAITILMISIVGPLTIASKGLTAAITSRDQVIASYLGQDEMEYLKNMRDGYLLANNRSGTLGDFLAVLTSYNCFNSNATNATLVCGIETAPTALQATNYGLVGCNTPVNCNLYLYTDPNNSQNSYYTYSKTSPNVMTQFNRTFSITQETISGQPDAVLVKVTVSWKNGTVPDQVVLNDIFFNTPR